MKNNSYQERVLRNALGFISNAFRPLKGAQRTAARGIFSRVAATLLSFLGMSRPTTKALTGATRRAAAQERRYPNGFSRSQEEARRVRQGKSLNFHNDGRTS